MTKNLLMATAVVATLLFAAPASAAVGIELTTNGGFETGDTSGWTPFVGAPSTFAAVSGGANEGNWYGEIDNPGPGAGNPLIKQANIGVGVVNPGDELEISFSIRFDGAAGGVAFVELFSELAEGGTSSNEILLAQGAPLADWTDFSFTRFAGSDVSGGVTLQFVAASAPINGTFANLDIDSVSVVKVIPEPGSFAMLGLGAIGLVARRRRRS